MNYSTIKKEILSIVLCISKFQSDLLNQKFLIRIDCKSAKHVLEKKCSKHCIKTNFCTMASHPFRFWLWYRIHRRNLKQYPWFPLPWIFAESKPQCRGERYSNPNPQDSLNSLLQHQVVPVRQRTLLAL